MHCLKNFGLFILQSFVRNEIETVTASLGKVTPFQKLGFDLLNSQIKVY